MTDRAPSIVTSGNCCPQKPDCDSITYSKCPQTIEPIKLKSTKLVYLDFYKDSCIDCPDRLYQHIRTIGIDKVNPAACPETEGCIDISNVHIDPETGLFRMSIDANDTRLAVGERFKITVWARLPDTSELCIEVYVSVSG